MNCSNNILQCKNIFSLLTGNPFRVSDVPNAIRLALTHNASTPDPQSKGILYKCTYWDPDTNDWAEEGVVTFGVDGSMMRCWSSHLTPFAVIETYDGRSLSFTHFFLKIIISILFYYFIEFAFLVVQ